MMHRPRAANSAAPTRFRLGTIAAMLRFVRPPGYPAGIMRDRGPIDTLTRAELTDAVWREIGLSRAESERFVEAVIETVTDALAAGETVKIPCFGGFVPRAKGPRIGRNPRTGEPAPIAARRVVVFRPSRVLKDGINARMTGTGEGL